MKNQLFISIYSSTLQKRSVQTYEMQRKKEKNSLLSGF